MVLRGVNLNRKVLLGKLHFFACRRITHPFTYWLERFVLWVVTSRQLPKYTELFDRIVFDFSVLAVKLLGNHITENSWQVFVELLQKHYDSFIIFSFA
jgi:hypothetical protein